MRIRTILTFLVALLAAYIQFAFWRPEGLVFALFLLCMLSGRASKLYSVMFVLALAMEIYGTRLGNWAWAAEAPWLGYTTINPPLAAGAFYMGIS